MCSSDLRLLLDHLPSASLPPVIVYIPMPGPHWRVVHPTPPGATSGSAAGVSGYNFESLTFCDSYHILLLLSSANYMIMLCMCLLFPWLNSNQASSESESGIFSMSSFSDDEDMGWSHSWPSTAWHCFLKGMDTHTDIIYFP